MPALAALVPLAWAVLLFHPAPDAGDIFGSLRDEADTWLAIHLGLLVFIGLTGAVALASRSQRDLAATGTSQLGHGHA